MHFGLIDIGRQMETYVGWNLASRCNHFFAHRKSDLFSDLKEYIYDFLIRKWRRRQDKASSGKINLKQKKFWFVLNLIVNQILYK